MIPVIKGKTYQIAVNSLGHSGEGVGKYQDFTVFIPLALPGEIVEACITEVKKTYAKGRLVKCVQESPKRIQAECVIYEACGGCQMQHVTYEAQLDLKRRQVIDAVERIGKQKDVMVHPTIGMESPWRYRNKMQFPIGKTGTEVVVGCYAQGTHAIVDTKDCLIQHGSNNDVASAIRGILKRLNITVYDETTGKGVMRHIIGRVGSNGEVMAVLVTATEVLPKQEKMIEELRRNIPGLASIMQNINTKRTNIIMGDRTKCLWGKNNITDAIGDFSFQISARSFFQVNTKQAEVLYKKALEYAGLTGKEIVVDVYCGTGTISLFLAQQAKKVYGIEIAPQAIKDAIKNAADNQIENVEFMVGDAVEVMPRLQEKGILPDVIVVDPPRAGCDKKVLETFAAMNPQRIIYVSCNPASLARDIEILSQWGYKAEELQPVDMFCQTSHVETVCLLSKLKAEHHIEVNLDMN